LGQKSTTREYGLSKRLIENVQGFLSLQPYGIVDRIGRRRGRFYGWGRRASGQKAVRLARKFGSSFVLLEDGLIRSVGLGVEGAASFSLIEDDLGIYYDATTPSRLEKILSSYDFSRDRELMETAYKAIALIKTLKISKYNNGSLELPSYVQNNRKKVLVIAQTAGDMSLRTGYGDEEGARQMLMQAIEDNPDADIYIKIHPDVLAGKKASNIDVEFAKAHCRVIEENIHPLVLLEAFDKVYTQTSQMGFEALMLGKEVHIFGAPFYVGWNTPGLYWYLPDETKRKIEERRGVARRVEELFAAAYILYSRYYNPIRKRPSNIIDTIEEIHRERLRSRQPKRYDYLCIGDSHIRIFDQPLLRKGWNRRFRVKYIPGATAYGIGNANSQTRAYVQFKEELERYDYRRIVVNLGEVDIAYALWRIVLARNGEIEELIQISLERYIRFLLELRSYAKVYVLSVPIPTVKDGVLCEHSKMMVRDDIGIAYEKKVDAAIKFNEQLASWCTSQKDIEFVDTTPYTMTKDKAVRTIFMPQDKCDHHYKRWSYALLLRLLFLKGTFDA